MGMKGGFSPGNAFGALVGGPAYVQYRQGQKAKDTAQAASDAAAEEARKTADLAQQAVNKANQKKPNAGALLAANQDGKAGQSGTMLTGPGGVDPSLLKLGKNTLLGGGGG